MKGKLDLGNEIEILQRQHVLEAEVANLVGVEDGVVEVEDDHGLVTVEHVLDEAVLVLLEGTARHQHVAAVGLVLKEVASELAELLLLDLLHTELASVLNDLLVLAYHLPNLNNHSILPDLFPMLVEIQQKGGLGEIGKRNFLIAKFADLRRHGKLFIEYYAPRKLVGHLGNIGNRIEFTNFRKRNGDLLLIVIFPESRMAKIADGY